VIADGLGREDRGGVAILIFDRPEKRNALTGPMLRGLISELASIGEDPTVRAAVLTGTGGAFCAGADVSALKESGEARPGDGGDAINAVEPAWWLADCPKPVVVAVDGVAVGLGAELVAQADLRIAAPTARIAWTFVHMGLIPDTGAGTGLLPRIVGLQHALDLVLSSDFVSAQRAVEIGLISRLVPSERLVDEAVLEARRLSRGSAFATSRIKRLMYASFERTAAEHLAASTEMLGECLSSDEYAEGVAAFLERREAGFAGRESRP
jgi:2-(1,2-epoxy-1,2-dihydrophenyl)acetyl-CoA isomerase